jgi:hypothetical protein
MARQLTLLDTPPSWRLDEATKAAGRKGIAEARASIAAAKAAAARRETDASSGSPQRRRTAA